MRKGRHQAGWRQGGGGANAYSDTESGGYIFYEQITTALEIGRTYPLTASGKKIAGLSGDFGVWIDFDDNAVFTVNECVYQGPNSESISAMIEIPNNPSILGEKRMRVANIWATSYLNPCLDYSNGETEDYIVNFVDTPIIKNYYCMPFDAFNDYNEDIFVINKFSFGEIHNFFSNSNDYNYSDYSVDEFSGTFILGETYEYTISNKPSNVLGGFSAWIDFNDNQIFEPSELVLEDGPNILASQGLITIPVDSSFLGERKLRVRGTKASSFPPDPCHIDYSTETEDYIIKIIAEPLINSTADLSESIDFNIFPNPSKDILNIEILENGRYDYIVYNLLGQVEKMGQINQQNIYPLNVEELSTGMYILEIKNDDRKKAVKFSKL